MEYKIYTLDSAGHISGPPVAIWCDSDEEAIRHAKPYLNGTAIEIWAGKKLLAKLEPEE